MVKTSPPRSLILALLWTGLLLAWAEYRVKQERQRGARFLAAMREGIGHV